MNWIPKRYGKLGLQEVGGTSSRGYWEGNQAPHRGPIGAGEGPISLFGRDLEEHKILLWLSLLSCATAERLSAFSGLTVATVSKNLAEYYQLGRVTSRMVGRGSRAQRVWILTSEALERFYSTDHRHRNRMSSDGHYHDVLDLEGADHQHVPWHLGQAGAKELYDRHEQPQAFQEIALRLFPEAGPEWLSYVGRETPSLRLWVPIRHGQLIEHSASYTNIEGDFDVVFCWLVRQLKPIRTMEK